ncbi:hypothetical protein AEM51_04185 [Bacteroidetes bacterium UKL13-3]|jgi:hypothetical protein|nr:hypothetical protein AEM51_04185 [Bacteroidetes bacterium UKL13-3]HCP93711.1 hypothetical protein [Bacteroidota bacterium]
MIKLRAFRAIDEPNTCHKYVEGHTVVLKDYGVTNVTSHTPVWIDNPHVYVVVAEETETSEIVGGIRVQIADGVLPLPIETAIGHMDQKVLDIVSYYKENGGVGELCGLWNSKSVAGKGISMILTRASIAIITQLRFRTLMGICADYTLPMFTQVGFVIDNTMGINGEFAYPNPNYITRVLGILNAETLETAYPYDKERMLTLRQDFSQLRSEKGPKITYDIQYQLEITNISNEEKP